MCVTAPRFELTTERQKVSRYYQLNHPGDRLLQVTCVPLGHEGFFHYKINSPFRGFRHDYLPEIIFSLPSTPLSGEVGYLLGASKPCRAVPPSTKVLLRCSS